MPLHAVHHIQITFPPEAKEEILLFYGQILGLKEIPRPEIIQNDIGAWYLLGDIQLHLSAENNANNLVSRRHVCFQVDNLAVFEEYLKSKGVEIIADQRPIPGYTRFFIRDPGGNRIEITEMKL